MNELQLLALVQLAFALGCAQPRATLPATSPRRVLTEEEVYHHCGLHGPACERLCEEENQALACGAMASHFLDQPRRHNEPARLFHFLSRECLLAEKQAHEGADSACAIAGKMALDGEGTAKNLENALHWFDRACAMRNEMACVRAGVLLGGPPNPAPLRALDDADGTRAESYYVRAELWDEVFWRRVATRRKYCAPSLAKGRNGCLAALEAELEANVHAEGDLQARCYHKWGAILDVCETVSFPVCDEFPPKKNGWTQWRCSGVLGEPVEGPPVLNKDGEEEP